jgi:hypothetical protein
MFIRDVPDQSNDDWERQQAECSEPCPECWDDCPVKRLCEETDYFDYAKKLTRVRARVG